MLQPLVPGGNQGLVIFCVGVSDTSPHVLAGRLGDDLGVDKGVHHRADKEMGLQKGTVLVVQNGHRRGGRAVGGNGGKAEYRLIIGDAQAFHCVQGLAASHAKDHVRLLVQGQSPQALHGGIGAVFPVDFSADNFQIRLSHVGGDFVIGGSQGFAPPDNQHFFAIGLAHRADFLVDLVADGVAGQMDLVIFQFHFDTSFRDKATKKRPCPYKIDAGTRAQHSCGATRLDAVSASTHAYKRSICSL